MNANKLYEDIPFTIQIPEAIYETFLEYQKRFKPHISIDALIAESIMGEVQNLPMAQLSLGEQ